MRWKANKKDHTQLTIPALMAVQIYLHEELLFSKRDGQSF